MDNADDESNALIDEIIDTGKVVSIKLPKSPAKPKSPQPKKEKPQEVVAPSVAVEEPIVAQVEQLLVDINKKTEPKEEVEVAPVEEKVAYQPQNDDEIIKKIEQIRNQPETEEDELVAQIKKLLDEMNG